MQTTHALVCRADFSYFGHMLGKLFYPCTQFMQLTRKLSSALSCLVCLRCLNLASDISSLQAYTFVCTCITNVHVGERIPSRCIVIAKAGRVSVIMRARAHYIHTQSY